MRMIGLLSQFIFEFKLIFSIILKMMVITKSSSLFAIFLKTSAYYEFQFFFAKEAGSCNFSEPLQFTCDETASNALVFPF